MLVATVATSCGEMLVLARGLRSRWGERAESVDIVNTSEAPLKRPYATLCDLGGTLFPPAPGCC